MSSMKHFQLVSEMQKHLPVPFTYSLWVKNNGIRKTGMPNGFAPCSGPHWNSIDTTALFHHDQFSLLVMMNLKLQNNQFPSGTRISTVAQPD
jgi:hypothetical protein